MMFTYLLSDFENQLPKSSITQLKFLQILKSIFTVLSFPLKVEKAESLLNDVRLI